MDEQKERPDPRPRSRKLFEEAVDDAQYLVAYAASKCEKRIKAETITTLITAKRMADENQPMDAEFEAKFWLAYQDVWELVKPATAESIKANLPIERTITDQQFANMSALSRWLAGKPASQSRRTVNRYIIFAVWVLIFLLIIQIYWVIGNQLTAQLAELLQRQTELSLQISENREEFSAIEIRFKQNEIDSESFKTSGVYTFYASPEWERDILENISAKARLETDLESLKSQLERSSAILLAWSRPWNWLIEKAKVRTSADIDQYRAQIDSIDRQIKEIETQLKKDPNGSNTILETTNQINILQEQLKELEKDPVANSDQIFSLRSQIDSLTYWVNQPGLGDVFVSQWNQDLERLKEEKASLKRQQEGDINRENSRQAQLAAQFVLVILQSYLLPLLYGLLGAGTSVLRSLSKEIERVTFSEGAGIQHLLRISLGALAGIMVGWFSFLIPDETTTFFGSVSPLAIAFLVGYNIELFFSLMDAALNRVNTMRQETSSTTRKEEPPTVTQDASTSSTTQATPPIETPVAGEAAG